jgi:hypothetical protein
VEWRLLGGHANGWLVLREAKARLVDRKLVPLDQVRFTLIRLKSQTSATSAVLVHIDSAPQKSFELSPFFSAVVRGPFWQPPSFSANAMGQIVLVKGGESDVRIYDSEGREQRRFAVAEKREPVTATAREEFLARWFQTNRNLDSNEHRLALMREMPGEKWWPVVHGVLAANNGRVAVIRSDRGTYRNGASDSVQVDIFSPAGEQLGHVVLPRSDQLLAFDGHSFFVARRDSVARITVEGRPRAALRIMRLRASFNTRP